MGNSSVYESYEEVFCLHLSVENLVRDVNDLEQVEYALLGVKRGVDHFLLFYLDKLETLLTVLIRWVRKIDFKNLVF